MTDKEQIKLIKEKPVETYFKLRNVALKQLAEGLNDFEFSFFSPILEKIIESLKSAAVKNHEEASKLLQEAQTLAEGTAPKYKGTHRFIMLRYLPFLDQILGQKFPELKDNNFHRLNAEPLLEMALANSPELLPIYTFEPLTYDFFLKTRAIPMPILGINLSGLSEGQPPPFADRFAMKTSEFTWHDWGHLEPMARKDLDYIKDSKKPAERVIAEWDFTRKRILEVREPYKLKDRDLYDALTLMLMEFVHERGYQYSLSELKHELEVEKWVEILNRKKQRGFFESFKNNDKAFDRLDDARLVLLNAIEQFKINDQIQWCETLRSEFVPVQITHTPKLYFAKGILVGITLNQGQRPVCDINVGGKTYSVNFNDLILAQVDPIESSPWTTDRIEKARSALAQSSTVIVTPTGEMKTTLADGQITNANADLLPQIEIFEMNQILGAYSRGESIAFTYREPIKVLSGRVSHYKSENKMIRIWPVDNSPWFELSLTEVRIDPLHHL